MKLNAEIGDQKLAIEVARQGGTVSAIVDGRSYEMVVSEPESNVYLFKYKGSVHEAVVSLLADGTHSVTVGRLEFSIRLADPKRLRGSGGGEDLAGGASEIKTAMPGKIVRILVAEGDQVGKGDGVIVVEAMKMQNEMKAPREGRVSKIKVSEGDTVAAGDVLAVID